MLRGGIERIVRAAMRSWAATFRLCLVISVIAATSAIVGYSADLSVLSSLMR
jgi:hypothetical protein